MNKYTGDLSGAALEFDVDTIIRFLVIMAVIVGIKAITAGVSALLIGRRQGITAYSFRDSFARHFAGIPYPELEKSNSGAMLSIYSNELPQGAIFVVTGVLNLVTEVLSVVVIFVYMLTISVLYTLIFFALFPLLIVLQVKISTPLQKKAREMAVERAAFNSVVNDSLQNTAIITAYSLENVIEARYLASYDRFFKVLVGYVRSLLILVISGQAATMLPIIFIYAAAGFSVINGHMTIAMFVAFTAVADSASSFLSMLSQRLTSLRVTQAGAEKLMENMAGETEELNAGIINIPKNETAVAFKDVSFAYPGGPEVLSGVSFEIKRGGKVAVVGGSGSGKSTIVKLLLGLYKPDKGVILVSGEDINGIAKSALRRHFAYVPQDNFMFPESIRENLAKAVEEDGEATMEKLEKACADAGILDFIKNLPKGFDTVLAESAENVSGGQRQRLAIARAFLRDAEVILFDEATSALDSATEAEVLKSFGRLTEGKSAVVVAHRLQAIASCDSIIVMDKGKVSGIGVHEDLLNTNRIYAELYQVMVEEETEGGVDIA